MTVQMPHDWKEGSVIFPHLHACLEKTGQATFHIEYKWYNVGEQIPEVWSTYELDQYSDEWSGTGCTATIIKDANGLDGTGKKISSILKLKLYRTDNVYVGDILVDQLDIHYVKNSLGSSQEYIK